MGTEHLVLGLYALDETVTRRALDSLGITRDVFVDQMHYEEGPSPAGRIPLTPRALMIVGLADAEAKCVGSDKIEPEHILLGVIRESEKLETIGIVGPHHLRAAAHDVGITLADVERNLNQEVH